MEPNQELFLSDLFQRCYNNLVSYAKICLGSPDLAEDMVQDTFHEAASHMDSLLQHPHPYGWLVKTLKFKICNYTRTQSRHRKHLVECMDLTVIPSQESVEQQVLEKAELPMFQRLSQILEEDEIRFLVDATLNQYSHAKLADKYGLTVWASAKRLSRIREKLRTQLPRRS